MDYDGYPLSFFEVDCDGSACGSGREAGLHVHPPQHDGVLPLARVVVRNGERIGYREAAGATTTPR